MLRSTQAGMTFFRLQLCFLLLFLTALKTHSETLILQSSDQHSSYKKMESFLAGIEVLYRSFKEKNPNGAVVLIINGDFSSLDKNSKLPPDKGGFGHFILSQLAKKYSLVYTFGNHDAFDWNDSGLFLDQMTLLKENGVHLVVENTDFYPEYKNLFQPYVDIPLSSDHKMRIIGWTLPKRKKDFLKKFHYKGPQVIDKIRSIHLEQLLREAHNQPDISAVSLSFHLGVSRIKPLIFSLPSELKSKLSVVFAGDDHKQIIEKIHGAYLVDSAAYFNFSQVLLDDEGRVLSIDFFDGPAQEKLSQSLKKDSLENSLINQTRRILDLKKPLRKKKKKPVATANIPKKQRAEAVIKKDFKPPCLKVFKGNKTPAVFY